jgi:hypothetical protein
MKPFAVINFDTYGLDTLVTQLAKAKILVNSYSTSPTESSAVAPYRWGAGSDTDAAASNSAEIIGKQLVGKKAEFGGDDVKGQTRKFGLVTIQDYIDLAAFNSALSKYGGKAGVVSPASELSYAANGSAAGDPVIAQQSAPTFVSKMKADGVTTVILFTDRAMNQALMDQADQQDWHPEWFYTGSGYTDFPFLVTALPDDQANHAFGISILPPYIAFPASAQALASPTAAYGWYWGAGVGTYTGLVQAGSDWLLRAIHYAGPDLTAKTVQQGLFSSPPTGGDPNQLLVMLSGYGRTTGLPYDSYNPGAADFVPFWMDPLTTAPSPGTGTVVKHASWYFDNPRRYHGGQWPTSFPWFDKSKSITELSEVPTNLPLPVAAPPCAAQACPATGAAAPKAGAAGSSFSVTPTPGAVPAA